jgi:hypothetical protein
MRARVANFHWRRADELLKVNPVPGGYHDDRQGQVLRLGGGAEDVIEQVGSAAGLRGVIMGKAGAQIFVPLGGLQGQIIAQIPVAVVLRSCCVTRRAISSSTSSGMALGRARIFHNFGCHRCGVIHHVVRATLLCFYVIIIAPVVMRLRGDIAHRVFSTPCTVIRRWAASMIFCLLFAFISCSVSDFTRQKSY